MTCVTCHRVAEAYGKVNGQRVVLPGGINAPVKGVAKDSSFAEIVADPEYPVATKEGEEGIPTHSEIQPFTQMSESEFCVSCHQVAVHPNIKLEVVWDQYRNSPAAAEGTTCQECHMGKTPGKAEGYETGPVAIVNGKPVGVDREHHNHSFYGPGATISHPGIFPFNPEAERWTIDEWLQFDYRAGWGTEDFEVDLIDGVIKAEFPETWADPVDREEARLVIEDNFELIEEKKELRQEVMNNGSKIDGPFFDDPPRVGESFSFEYKVTNTNNGHNLPSGSLGAQPEIWLNVALTNPSGETVWESGYVDSYGDMADLHSMDVAAGMIDHDDQLFNLQTKFLTTNVKGTDREMPLPVRNLVTNTNNGHNLPSGSLGAQPEIWLNVALTNPSGETVWESGYVDSYGDMADLHSMDVAAGMIDHDDQLFNLQTKFLTTNVKGTDREMPLPVNFDIDPIPFLRPGAVPTTVLNHPPFIRMEGRSLPPLADRIAKYKVPADAMTEAGTYRLSVRLRSRAEPIYFMRFVDATIEMEQAMNEWIVDIHPYAVEIDVQP